MRELPYQTFPSINSVYIGADAMITIEDSATTWPHNLTIRDRDRQLVVQLLLTTDALVALQSRINTVLDDPTEVASWAARDLAGLALREAMVVS